jgi:replication-associated recombination protein RarA
MISSYCDGDARVAYNILEIASYFSNMEVDKKNPIGIKQIEKIIQKKLLLYDKEEKSILI